MVQQRIDSLNLIVEGGGGWAVGKRSVTGTQAAKHLTELHQWQILAGIAYEGDWAQGWHVGGRITAGVTIFGANYTNPIPGGPPVHEDTSTAGTVEGRLEGGYRVGRVVIRVAIGVSQPWNKDPRLYSPNDIGGFCSGIFFNWR